MYVPRACYRGSSKEPQQWEPSKVVAAVGRSSRRSRAQPADPTLSSPGWAQSTAQRLASESVEMRMVRAMLAAAQGDERLLGHGGVRERDSARE